MVALVLVTGSCHSIKRAITPGGGPVECSGTTCTKWGLEGECVRGACVLGGGHCSQDIDCDDGNDCTHDRCERGTCVSTQQDGSCALDGGGDGQCVAGFCEWRGSPNCTTDKDCPAVGNPCLVASCVDGACKRSPRAPGADCETAVGRKGTCGSDGCEISPTKPTRSCRVVWNPYLGARLKCTVGLRYSLPPDKVAKAEAAIAKGIAHEDLYDLKAALVKLPKGGYNIALFNRRPRSDVRGLCDPSLVAWNVSEYTRHSNWKSADLQIWLNPYREGWGLSTRGGRTAVHAGQASSPLGALGVVQVEAFRRWLLKAFRPLKAPWRVKATGPSHGVVAQRKN